MKAFCYENEIVVFWQSTRLAGEYSVYLNGQEILKTDKTFCRINDLKANMKLLIIPKQSFQ